jgi:hypothetical protein
MNTGQLNSKVLSLTPCRNLNRRCRRGRGITHSSTSEEISRSPAGLAKIALAIYQAPPPDDPPANWWVCRQSEKQIPKWRILLTRRLDREESVGQNGTPHDEIPMKITRSIRGMTYLRGRSSRNQNWSVGPVVTCDTVSKCFRQRAVQ